MFAKFQKSIVYIIVASEFSHIFCCVLPTIFSLISLLAGLGIISAMPTGLNALHDMMHEYEIPMIAVSGVLIVIGWCLHVISKKLDCHDGEKGCEHAPCEPKKDRTNLILKIATILFLINVIVYFGVHRTDFVANTIEHTGETHDDHNHDGHDHHDH